MDPFDLPPESKIVVGHIQPMMIEDIRLPDESNPINAEAITVELPIPAPDVHVIRLESASPLIVTPESLDYAAVVANRIIAMLGGLPHTREAGDLIAMAYAVLHYQANKPSVIVSATGTASGSSTT